MFRNRRNSQKPSDDLYKNFRATFPQLGQSVSSDDASATAAPTTTLAEPLDITLERSAADNSSSQSIKDADATPRASNDPWSFGTSGLTPSMMDPNSQNFNVFANQLPGYYTPTPGGTNTLYHSQHAGDLHTPSFSLGLGTPLSLPTSESALHAGQQMAPFQHAFHGQMQPHMQAQPFQGVNPYQMHHHHQQTGYPPHQFTHRPSFDTMESAVEESPVDDLGMSMGVSDAHHSPNMLFHSRSLHRANTMPTLVHPSAEKFRYHVTLNAPTAMIKSPDEIPITYLNKGQAYTLNIVDTQKPQLSTLVKYRTFVRVSFEDDQQRHKPAACWQLWKEGRGTNEAHQRGGRLQAVEYVDPGQVPTVDDHGKLRMELESASFDGFCVTWIAPANVAECHISVRFNFLSTDFSHSKGVKGIPVRLCAKTEMLGDAAGHASLPNAEVCYCKVKLFRDHGAERKLSNDVAHVKKTIEKVNQQIAQVESGMRDLGKRKRSGSNNKSSLDNRPVKVAKHRRTWSVTSQTSNSGRNGTEDDLHTKLMSLQEMFTSPKPASVLYLRGDDEDDPDAFPVKLSGENPDLARTDSAEVNWEQQSAGGRSSPLVSPTPSSKSVATARKDSTMQQPTPIASASRENSNDWRVKSQSATAELAPPPARSLITPQDSNTTRVQTRSPSNGAVSGWIEAVGVDPSYRAPPERLTRPVACFYIQPRIAGEPATDSFYRAVYVAKRSLEDFVGALASKCDIEPTHVLRTYRVTRSGLQILFDDECIRELPEGQDMTAEFCETASDPSVKPKREWDVGPTDEQSDGELGPFEGVPHVRTFELKLLY